MSSQRAFSQRSFLSLKNGMNSLATRATIYNLYNLQELHWTNEPKAERIRATRLGYLSAQNIYLLGHLATPL